MQKTTIQTLEMAESLVGASLGPSPWRKVTQDDIDAFARATGDYFWLHVDQERAAAESPVGRTIAHGYLTRSLAGQFHGDLVSYKDLDVLNYGCERVRFIDMVPVDSKLRGLFEVIDVVRKDDRRVNITYRAIIERDGASKPACTLDIIHCLFRKEL